MSLSQTLMICRGGWCGLTQVPVREQPTVDRGGHGLP